MKYKNITITLNNSKLGGFIPSIDLPPIITCRKNAPCIKGCYALKGRFAYPVKKESMRANLEAYKQNPKEFFNTIISFLNDEDISYKFFRWFGAGDIVDSDFLIGACEVAKQCPTTKFLMFTKKFELVNEYLASNTIPDNLHIVFSMWDKNFIVDNPYNLPKAYVNFKKKELNPIIPEYAFHCLGDCPKCKSCWSLIKEQSVYFDLH